MAPSQPTKKKLSRPFEEITVYHHKTKLEFTVGPKLTIKHKNLNGQCTIDFEQMQNYLGDDIIESFRHELCSRIAECYALSSITTFCTKLKELCKLFSEATFSQGRAIYKISENKKLWSSFISWLKRNPNMKSFLISCNGDKEILWCVEYNLAVETIRTSSRKKGSAISSADPVNGALTETEVRDVTFAICNGYENGLLEIEHLAVFFLALVLGYRQSQILNITLDDLTYSESHKNWTLKIEIIKQKRKNKPVYMKIRLPPLVNTLLDYMVPLCISRNKTYLIHNSCGVAGLKITEEEIKKLPDTRCRATTLMTKLKNVIYEMGVRSSRVTGERINLNFIRFKHTLLTRAAVNGASAHELMYLGLHNNISSANSYIDSIPEAQARIKEELGPALTSIAKLFLGSPYEGGYEKAILEMPNSIQRHYGIAQAKPIGVCGTMANCTDHAPIACLLCSKFEPFRDAPFGEYKEYLISEYKSQPDIKIKNTVLEYVEACDMWISKLSVNQERAS